MILIVAGTVASAPACGNDYTLASPAADAGADAAVADASLLDSAASSPRDAGTDAAPADAGKDGETTGDVFPPACDGTVKLAEISCTGPGNICGARLDGYAGDKSDLIECDAAGHPTCVRHCMAGCMSANTGTDACVECPDPTAADIWYCGKQIGLPAPNGDIAFHCSAGKLATSAGTASANCGANLCHEECTRTNPPPTTGACCMTTPDP